MSPEGSSERPLGELFTELARETGLLVKQEVQLAQTEMTAKVTTVAKQSGVIGAGAALAHTGLLAIVAAVILGLGTLIPMWLSAFLVGLAVSLGGYALVRKGTAAIKGIDPVPRVAVQTLREDKTWLKEQARQ